MQRCEMVVEAAKRSWSAARAERGLSLTEEFVDVALRECVLLFAVVGWVAGVALVCGLTDDARICMEMEREKGTQPEDAESAIHRGEHGGLSFVVIRRRKEERVPFVSPKTNFPPLPPPSRLRCHCC